MSNYPYNQSFIVALEKKTVLVLAKAGSFWPKPCDIVVEEREPKEQKKIVALF